MKVTIKNINKEIYVFEVNGDLTVAELKNLISEKHNQTPSWQTLIYSGKILEDKRTLESYNITDSGFIVMMIKKPRESAPNTTPAAPAAPATTTAEPTQSTTNNTSTTTPTTVPTPTNNTPATPNPTPTTSSTPGSTSTTSPQQSSDFATGSELEATIKNIIDMGFERDQVLRALRLTFNNAERAIEYLVSGTVPAANDPEDEDDMEGGGGSGDNPFEALRNHPHFNLLREAISKNPSIIPGILQQLAQTNPALVRQIQENPNEFIRLFQDDAGGNPGGNPGQFTLQVTQEESEAIQRLQALTGMDKSTVIEAYFACDKNEELTASYLFETADDE
ncbi:hypothetical protein RB653_000323 [Dictyostelium firmibasis]|uniref:UV excision repair protein RAD23 n=1 Tax=Dictyostelium firmibasis TaxID=79012 RepID=A0AAN7TWH1_9MYCE